MNSKRLLLPLAGSIVLLLPTTRAAELSRANNNSSPLNDPGAWAGGVVPTATDVMLWDSTFTLPVAAASLPQLGGDMSVMGIKVTNVGGAANAANTQVGFQNTSSGNILTIGASGINLSAATQAIQLQSKITIGASQNWIVANANTNGNPSGFNNGEDLSFQALAAGAAFNLGGKTVTTSGVGAITITSGYTLDNGTINVGNALFVVQGGGNRVTNVNSNVNFGVASGSTLLFQSNSGAGGASLTSAANVTLNGGTMRLVSNNATNTVITTGTLNVASASTVNVGNNVGGGSQAGPIALNMNLTGSAALSLTHTASSTNANGLVLGGNNSGYSGTVSLSGTAGRIFRLNTATAGSAAATWSVGTGVVLQTSGVAVDLGTLTGNGTVNNATGAGTINVGAGNFAGTLVNGTGTLALTKVGTGTLTLSGANTYTGATSVNGGSLITSPAQTGATTITVADGANFGVKLASAGTTFSAASLTTGTTTGASLSFDTGALGNPTAAVINAAAFTSTAPTTLKMLGSNLAAGPQFVLLDYTGSIGGTGFGGLSLSLPFRVTGNLVDNTANSSVDAIITGTVVPAWRGTINNNWDVDSVGDGSTGTANWFAPGGPNTYVQGAPVGTDSVLFDDSVGAGPTNVNLTTTLAPVGVTVNNSTVNYTFSGSGKVSGSTGLTKTGTGTLILANTTANDYTGTTTINNGTLRVGDGTTAGAGSLGAGAVSNSAVLVLDRPDDFSIAGVTSGAGTLTKNGAGTATFTAANTSSGAINLNAGKLKFSGGGNLSGVISGNGELESAGGTLQLSGSTANTNSGVTTVSAGRLELSKSGVNAVGGNINITGTGQLALLVDAQIPDTATINFTGSSTDSIPTQNALETVGNVIVNSSVPGAGGGQVIMRNGFTVLGTGTVTSGILGVGSGQTGTVNAINITATDNTTAIVRIAGNSAASILNVGTGGITASGGDIQVKFNTNNQDAVLNLEGDFTTTGNVIVTNAGYAGANLNVINLIDDRTFNIGGGTTTTVAPDIGGEGSFTKAGTGTLILTNLSQAAHTGATHVSGGVLVVNGTLGGSQVLVDNGAALQGTGTITAPLIINGQLQPGASPGTLMLNNTNLTLGANSETSIELGGISVSSYDRVIGINALNLDGIVTVSYFGSYNNPAFGDTFDLFDFATIAAPDFDVLTDLILPPLDPTLEWDRSNFLTSGAITVVPEPGSTAMLFAGLASLLGIRRRRP